MTRESAAGVITVQPPAFVETDRNCRGSTDSIMSGRARRAAFVVNAEGAGARKTRRTIRSSADHNHFVIKPFPGERDSERTARARGSWGGARPNRDSNCDLSYGPEVIAPPRREGADGTFLHSGGENSIKRNHGRKAEILQPAGANPSPVARGVDFYRMFRRPPRVEA